MNQPPLDDRRPDEMHSIEEQRRRAERMDAIRHLSRVVAHDFNNVLAAILATADLLALQLKEQDPVREDIEQIRKAVERGSGLTRRLLSFSQSLALETALIDVNVFVVESTARLQQLAGETIVLRVRTADQPAPVRAVPGGLEQVLTTLVMNARDAMPTGGAIDIDVTSLVLEGSACRRYWSLQPGPYVRLSVSDTGTGLDPAVQTRIFEPFLARKDRTKRSGVGLATAYRIVRDAGGTITVSTAPGKGTTFEILLPRVHTPA